ncbi:MAG: hypothetical protein MUP27_08880 [Desulfobacterales bacterium]|nr:hypothetical protein [Desulfobacterales bacterium]
MEKARDIDSKFAVSTNGKIYKKSNNEIIPDDEPLFLLRGRDVTAITQLEIYRVLSRFVGCNTYHFEKLAETLNNFRLFDLNHPERMKMPSITEGK